MDDNIVPEAEHLAIVLRKLQEVFDVCDEDCDGWIRVEHFVDLGSQFGRGEEVSPVVDIKQGEVVRSMNAILH